MRLAKLWLLLLLAAGVEAQESTTAIVNAVILDGHGGAPIENGTVLIRGEKIEAVGENVRVPSGAKVIDANGRAAMPGLADMHVHLVGGWDGDATDMLGYQRYLNALLYCGVTGHAVAGTARGPRRCSWTSRPDHWRYAQDRARHPARPSAGPRDARFRRGVRSGLP